MSLQSFKFILRILIISVILVYVTDYAETQENKESIIVIGEATIKVKPDRAYVNVVVNAKANFIESLLANIKDKFDTLEKNIEEGILRKEIPDSTIRKYGFTPAVEKKVIGYKKESESLGSDIFPEGGDYIRETTDKGVNIYRKVYIYEYRGSQEFTIVIEDTSNINKIEQFILKLFTIDENITTKQTPLSDYEPGIYVGVVKYGFKEETNEKIRTEVIDKAFEKAHKKVKTFAEKLNLKGININKISIFEEKISYGNNLVETGFIPVIAKVKLIFFYPN